MSRPFAGAVVAAIASLYCLPASAAYPERPITFIIPFGAGGGADLGARTWEPFMEKCLGVDLVMVNKPGAGGEVGFAEIATSPADGYTFGAMNVPNLPLGTITKQKPTYTMASFTYIGNMYGSRTTINTKRGGAFSTLKEMQEVARTRPLTLGLSGFGSDDHVMMLRFMKMAGVPITLVPLGDAASARNGVIGGHVDLAGLSMTEVAPFQGELQTLAITSAERMPQIADVPTFREQGFDLVGGSTHLIGGPAGMPQEAVDKLDGCFTQVAADPEFLKVAKERNLLMDRMTAAQASEWIAKETDILKTLWQSDPWVK